MNHRVLHGDFGALEWAPEALGSPSGDDSMLAGQIPSAAKIASPGAPTAPAEPSERWMLQKLGDDGEPVQPPVYRTGYGTCTDPGFAYTWTRPEDAVEAAPGPGWAVVRQPRKTEDGKR